MQSPLSGPAVHAGTGCLDLEQTLSVMLALQNGFIHVILLFIFSTSYECPQSGVTRGYSMGKREQAFPPGSRRDGVSVTVWNYQLNVHVDGFYTPGARWA